MAKAMKQVPAKAATPDAVKAKGAESIPQPEPKRDLALVTVKSTALSKDVGPRIIHMMQAKLADESQAKGLLAGVREKTYTMMTAVCMAIDKAVRADSTIDLTASVRNDKKAQEKLNNQIGLALGYRDVVEITQKNGAVLRKIAYTPQVEALFNPQGDTVTAADTARGKALRSNFLTLVKKCQATVLGARENGMTLSVAEGTLMLTGGETKKHFGAPSVLLNEKMTAFQTDKKGNTLGEIKLAHKPSFQAIADMAHESLGTGVSARRIDSRAKVVDPQVFIAQVAAKLVQAIGKLPDKPSAETVKSLKQLRDAIDDVV